MKGEKEKALGRGGKREIRGERERWRIWVHVNEEEQARSRRGERERWWKRDKGINVGTK